MILTSGAPHSKVTPETARWACLSQLYQRNLLSAYKKDQILILTTPRLHSLGIIEILGR